MKCDYCNSPNHKGSLKCEFCGAPLTYYSDGSYTPLRLDAFYERGEVEFSEPVQVVISTHTPITTIQMPKFDLEIAQMQAQIRAQREHFGIK